MIHKLIEKAYIVLDGAALPDADAYALMREIHGTDILDLVSLANKVRQRWAAEFVPCSIVNAKSGECVQNCKFCAQSAHHHTEIECYPLLDHAAILESARQVYEHGVRSFGIVTSGYGYLQPNAEFEQILATMDCLYERFPDMKICVSIGMLSRETAKMLAQHHIGRYNMNLQTNPAKYAQLIADTHSIQEKIDTIKYLQEFGVEICCGGIIGLGETPDDRVAMALAVRELKVEGIPLNILLPIPGTKLENQPVLSPAEAAKAFAIFRLVNPKQQIKFAAGRETVMKDFQGLLMLAGANSIITGGYLTTRGRTVAEDETFLRQLKGFC
jgi:biotin synthase